MKLLIADDDPVTLDGIAESLEREGFDAIRATNGREALKAWKLHSPDLVCLDIMMPEMDGFEVCRRIRSADPAVPVLFLSAKNEEIDVVVGLELGADDFIRKPFGKRELIARIRTAIRRSSLETAANEKPVFVMGDLTIYPRELRAVRKDVEIELTPREVSILKHLHKRKGEAISRDELLNECWGIDYFPESRTLDQHISKLRKRIEADPENPTIIETVRRLGYRYRG